ERRTRESGEAWFWSRSRGEYWHKGETSGNMMAVEELRDDCDGDALLLRVRPAGPACHTGSVSCFAPALWRAIAERAAQRAEVAGNVFVVREEDGRDWVKAAMAVLRSAPPSDRVICCYCGLDGPRASALRLSISRESVRTTQSVWAHSECFERATEPAKIEL